MIQFPRPDPRQLARTLQDALPFRRQCVALAPALDPIGQPNETRHSQLVQVGIEIVAPQVIGLGIPGRVPGVRCRFRTLTQDRFQLIGHSSS